MSNGRESPAIDTVLKLNKRTPIEVDRAILRYA